jgi:hypothetical protein
MLLTVEQFYELSPEKWTMKLRMDFPVLMNNVSVRNDEERNHSIQQLRKQQAKTLHDITLCYKSKSADEIYDETEFNCNLIDYCDTISALNSIIGVLENLEF